MEKLKMHSPDFTEKNIERLAELFPGCVTEAADEGRPLKRVIDFDQLRQELTGAVVDGPRERYHLNWPGKKEALLAANSPIAKTLRPCREESVQFDDTRNLFIEGDNLDVLKLLQETYLNKVKMIYIDPPYNTGHDFIYDDDFSTDGYDYFLQTRQEDDDGNRLVLNQEANGRFHTDWINMIYPRLKLARSLLRDDGLIFISIGDDEQANLKKACDEVFGAVNFLGCACRVAKKTSNQGDYWSPNFDYVLTYARNKAECRGFFGGVNYDAYNETETEGPRKGEKYQLVRLYMTSLDPMRGCINQRYFVEAPDGTLLIPPGEIFPTDKTDGAFIPPETAKDKVWRWARDSYLKNKDRIVVKEVSSSNLVDSNGGEVKWNVYTKTYLRDVIANTTAKPNSLVEGHLNQNSSHELRALGIPFSFAKPVSLIRYLCEISRIERDDIVMDFFAGSGTTAHAVMDYNASNDLTLRYVLVQLPETLSADDKNQQEAHAFCEKLGAAPAISEICKERIRRAGKRITEDNAATAPNLDVGFRVLKLDATNLKDVYYTPDSVKQSDLLDQIENIKEDRTPEDLLFQVLLDWGVDLSLAISEETIEGTTVFFVDENSLAACFDRHINEELVKKLAARKPLRAVFRDSGYGNDSVKINVERIFKLISPGTEVKSI